ncbi:MAG: hypothetical protein ABJ235_07875, partial [Sulfitobacter pontiacus]|uniref:hypothetical protein n=1 Tax=Sulfitobacter pontiacus TaxID=60137 RepID=UPI00329722BD
GRQDRAATGTALDRLTGSLNTNPDDPFDQQVRDAMAKTFTKMVSNADNDAVCESVERWLTEAIAALPTSNETGGPNDD